MEVSLMFNDRSSLAAVASPLSAFTSRRGFLRTASIVLSAPALAGAQRAFASAPDAAAEGTAFDAKVMSSLADFTALSFDTGGPTPYGAAIVNTATGEELMRAVNKVQLENDPSAHGEVTAIRLACRKIQSHSLKGYTLYTTCEPCAMCTVCCLNAQLDRVVYGAATPDVRLPGGHGLNLRAAEVLTHSDHPYTLVGHVERDRCVALFTELRKRAAAKQEPAKPA
jgi:tRNA(Arg) A34 adenosine deaminase TadA